MRFCYSSDEEDVEGEPALKKPKAVKAGGESSDSESDNDDGSVTGLKTTVSAMNSVDYFKMKMEERRARRAAQ